MKKHPSEQFKESLTCLVFVIAFIIILLIANIYFIPSKTVIMERIALSFIILSISFFILIFIAPLFVIPLNIKYTKIKKLLNRANIPLEQESLYYKLVTEILDLQQNRIPTDTVQNISQYKNEIVTIVSERVKILQKLNKNKKFISQEMPLNEKYMDILNKLNDINKIVDEILQFPNKYAELQKERESLRESLDIEKANTERYLETISYFKKEKDDIEKSRALAQHQINEIEGRKTTQSIQYHFIKEKIENAKNSVGTPPYITFHVFHKLVTYNATVINNKNGKEYNLPAEVCLLAINPKPAFSKDFRICIENCRIPYLIKIFWPGKLNKNGTIGKEGYSRFPSGTDCIVTFGEPKILTDTKGISYTITVLDEPTSKDNKKYRFRFN